MKEKVVSKGIEQKHQEDLQRIKNFRLFDDDFFTKCFEGDTACTELVLQIVLDKPDLKVLDVHTQVFVANLVNHSVRLDILATDSQNKKYNIEIQRADKGAGKKRARYNSSMMDANYLEKGEEYDKLPETYVVFITEHDVIGRNLPLYHVERQIMEIDESFGDGAHILYVNSAYRDGTPVGRLMQDFACTEPSKMHYKILADRTRFFKEEKEGVAIMCKAIEDMRNESLREGMEIGREEGKKELVLQMLSDGRYSVEEIAALSGFSVDEVKLLQESQMS